MNHLFKTSLASLLMFFVYGATAQTWTITVPARTEPTSSAGSNYSIVRTMTVGAGVCGGNSYLVGIPASGTSDYTSTEADHIANWYQVYDGLSKVLLVAPASITYNCFSYAMSPALDWIQDYELLDCILNSTYTEVNKIEDADIVLHFERHGDLIHASKTIVFAHWWSIPIYGCQGKYGAVGVYKSGAFFPAQFYGLDLDGDKFFTTNP